MSINNRIKHLERNAHAKVHKYHKIELYIADWCECNNDDCENCGSSDLPSRQIIDGEIVINVGADDEYL